MPKTGIRPYETKTKGLRWLAYYYRDGKQVLRRGFRTSRQAEQWRAQALTSVESPADTSITVGEWLGEWLGQHRARVRPSTYERYEGSLRLWVVPHIGMVQLTELTHRHIEEMHRVAMKAGLSPQTVRRNHSPLRGALQDAVRDGVLPHNPAVLVRLPPIHKPEIQTFTHGELQRFLDGNREHQLYPVYHLALYSGLRLGEILALRVGRDIDLATRTLTVRETRRQGVTGPPKSKESARRVMLAPLAADVLDGATANKGWGQLAFPMHSSFVTHSMPRACNRAGVKSVRFHDLRHTHATLLLAAGENIHAVSARLGHASVGFTLSVYGHVMPGMQEKLAEATASWAMDPDSIKTLSLPNPNGAQNPASTAL